MCVVLLQRTDAGGHLADILHGLHKVLLHRHNQYPPELCEKWFFLAAHAVQHLAVVFHGLNQILSKNVLHNINTSKIECVKFVFCCLGADTLHPSVGVL